MQLTTYLPFLLAALQLPTILASLTPREPPTSADLDLPAPDTDFDGYSTPARILSSASLRRRGKPLRDYDDPLGCETSKGSPPKRQVMTMADTVLDNYPHNQLCRQRNKYASRCTKYRKNGEAALSVCGENPVPKGPTCWEIAEAAKIIAEKCVGTKKGSKEFDRVGGWYILYKWNVWVAVH